MNDKASPIGREVKTIGVFLGVVWGAFLLDQVIYGIDFTVYGLVPRTLSGTVGIVSMPLLHSNFGHLLGNTLPLFLLLVLLIGSQARSWEVVVEIIVLGGVFLWVCGRNAIHVGASGLVFGLAAFLIVSGLRERRVIPLAVAFIVAFLYGGTLLWGVLPVVNARISWDGHLCGAVAGGLIAWFLTRGVSHKAADSSIEIPM